jgi:DNA-directed RNA polymerase subunit K/omega
MKMKRSKKIIIEDSDINDEIDDDIEDNGEEEYDDLEEDDDEEDEEEIIAEVETDIIGCLIEETINEDDEYFNNNEAEYNKNLINNKAEYVLKENRVSSNRLTKYEMVRILGERIKQLTMGAKPLIKNYKGLSYDKIAEEELILNMIPFKIKRPLPNNMFEIWSLEELSKNHLLSQL